MKIKNLFKTSLKQKISQVLGQAKSQEEIFEEVEELMILSDISAELVDRILENARKNSKLTLKKDDFFAVLKEELRGIFETVGRKRFQSAGSILPVEQLFLSKKKSMNCLKAKALS